jgi:hypothetical protein
MERVLIPASLLAGGLLIACAGTAGTTDDDTSAPTAPSALHLTEDRESAAPTPNAQLTYYGGPVLSSVNVHAIYWNQKVKYQKELNAFYQAVTQSEYFDWLNEYDTPTQHIGRGQLAGSFVDKQSGTDVTNSEIEAELARLIDAKKLPSPTADDLYMVHFPPGVTVTQDDGSASCQVFCAYHGTFKHKGKNVYFGVVPDLGGACAGGCGQKAQLENTTAATSHEMIEAVTDAAVGLATTFGPPLAWYDQSNGEIGDICVGQDDTIAGYNVQREWSNAAGACIASKPGGSCSCAGKSCGDDGCGHSCGTCDEDQSCGSDGKCHSSSGGGGGSGGSGGGGGGGSGGGGDCKESEPNNKADQANPICASGTMSGTIDSSGDIDWYTWTVSKSARYTVTLSQRSANFDMTIYHASASGRLTRVDGAHDPTDNNDEQLTHRSRSGGTYLVKVLGTAGAHSSKPYALTVTMQ